MIIGKVFTFEAAHSLMEWPEDHPCKRVHGHSYKVEVLISGPILRMGKKPGAVVDFHEVGQYFREQIFNVVDHQNLNEVLAEKNTTAEFLAEHILKMMHRMYPVHLVRVWETATGYAEARP